MARPDPPTAAPAQPEAQEGERSILDTYERLHAGKLGMHWLWCVIEQIAAGVPEDEAMREFRYYERAAAPAEADPIAEAILKGLTHSELHDKALYLMTLNANQARTIDTLRAAALKERL